MPLQNKCQLITYPDSLGSSIADLHYVMNRYFSGCFGGVHILPFYPSSGDRGFAPLTYQEVDPTFGDWEDVEILGREYDIMVDFMVNHISQRSEYFQDFLQHGEQSQYADMFLRFKKLAPPHGDVSSDDLAKVYTRKPRPPYYEANISNGVIEKVWCTFDYEQIDLDVFSEVGAKFVRDMMIFLARRNINCIRVDAFGYTVKKLGTSCFFVEPETSNLLRQLEEYVKPFDVELLPEIHEHHSIQLKLASQGYYVYDFALPFLCLQALFDGDNKNLINWLNICPRKQFTTLDTHDGLPVVDVVDLMTTEEIERTKDNLYEKGANVQRRYSVSAEYHNLDVYQVNCTYYSALGDNDDAYLTARAIQFFSPGIPQVYYVGALAGKNDIERVERTKVGREINRHNYLLKEIDSEVDRPVIKRLITLMRFRNDYGEVFNGEMKILDSPKNELRMLWQNDHQEACLVADLSNYKSEISYKNASTNEEGKFMV